MSRIGARRTEYEGARLGNGLLLLSLIFGLSLGVHAQGQAIGNSASTVINNVGRPLAGAGVAICQPIATTAASVASNIAVLTMTGNPITEGFAAGGTIQVAGFTGGDTYFNGGSLVSGQIASGFPILTVTSTTISFALTHVNASAASNGTVLQEGSATTPCAGLSTVYTDPTDTVATANPFTTDGLGNWQAFGPTGNYYVQFYGPGIATTLKTVTGGVPVPVLSATNLIGPGTATGNYTHSGTETFTGAILCKNLENVQCVDSTLSRGGADIGAEINLAYAALPARGGLIWVAPQTSGLCYNYSTPIVLATLGKYAILQGLAPAGGGDPTNPGLTCLNYTPTTATVAITLDWTQATASSNPGGGLRDIALVNNNCATLGGCGSSTVGVKIGGTNHGAQFALFQNVLVAGFSVGIQQTDGQSWGIDYTNCIIRHNATGYSESTAVEVSNWFGGLFLQNGADVALASNSLFKSVDTHFDDATGVYISAGGAAVRLINPHFENLGSQTNTHYFSGSDLVIFGGEALDDNAAGNKDYWFTTTSVVEIEGLSIGSAGATVTNLTVVSGQAKMAFNNKSPAVLTPCPTFATSSICSQVSTTGTPFLRAPTLRLGTTAGDYTLAPTPADSGHTATFPAATGTVGIEIATGTAVMTTAAIVAGNCGALVAVAATGALTTDTITWAFNAQPAGSNSGLVGWVSANNVNFAYCPNSAETPAAATINWRAIR